MRFNNKSRIIYDIIVYFILADCILNCYFDLLSNKTCFLKTRSSFILWYFYVWK